MKITLFMAASVNGMIASPDYSENFFSDKIWDYSLNLYKNYDCVIWGRKTYETVNTWEEKYTTPIKDFPKIIISSDSNIILSPNDRQFSSPELAFEYFLEQKYNNVLLSGGSITNTSFAKLNLIDEVIFLFDSIIIGEGIPIFSQSNFALNLEPIMVVNKETGPISIHYKVIK